MRLTIICMISNGSLSAFSAGVAQSSQLRQDPVQRVRAAGAAPAGSAAPTTRPGLQFAPGTTPPATNLPRGSLLDLSV
jgi:hypothetical protein